jgi:hypothetical protein
VGLFAKLFGHRRLRGLTEPTRVKVFARVASPNDVVSPMSGLYAAAFSWKLSARMPRGPGWYGGAASDQEIYELVGRGVFGAELALNVEDPEHDGAITLAVPLSRAHMLLRGWHAPGAPLDHPLPEELAHSVKLSPSGLLYFLELPLMHGERVRLEATAGPLDAGAARGPYRSTNKTEYRVFADLGPIVIEESEG